MDRIIEDTDDIIITSNDKVLNCIATVLMIFLIGLWAYIIWNSVGDSDPSFVIIFMAVAGLLGVSILLLILELLENKTVAINKKSQSMIIKKDSKIGFLKSVKEIPFSLIECIEIKKNSVAEAGDFWNIYIIPILGRSIQIYRTNSENDAERLGKKISEITVCNIIRSSN